MTVKVHIGINGDVFSFDIEDISAFPKKFRLKDRYIKSLDDIVEISIADDLFILTNRDPAFRITGRLFIGFDECSTDTIKAYNWDGEFLWSIDDIIKGLTGEYLGGWLINRAQAVTDEDPLPDGGRAEDILACVDPSHPLFACLDGGWRYVLDLKDKRVLFRTSNR